MLAKCMCFTLVFVVLSSVITTGSSSSEDTDTDAKPHLMVPKRTPRQSHSKQYLFSCSRCEKCFSSRSGLSVHTNIHTGKYKCTICGKCCGTSNHLSDHMRSHSGDKPFECTVCSKRFTQSSNLVTHSRVHSRAKLYKCSLCSKHYSNSSYLQRHKCGVYRKVRPHPCPCCGKLFAHHASTHTGAQP